MFQRLFVAYLLLAYPFYWAASAITVAVPALLRVAFFDSELSDFGFNQLSLYLFTTSPSRSEPAWLRLVIDAGPASLTALFLWRFRANAFACFAILALGAAGLSHSLPRWSPRPGVSSLVFLGMIYLGCVLVSIRLPAKGYGKRLLLLWSLTVIPLLTVPLLYWLSRPGFGGPRFHAFPLFAGPLAALLASALAAVPFKKQPGRTAPPVSWKPAIAGAFLVLIMITALPAASSSWRAARRDSIREAARSEVASLPPLPIGQPYPRIFFQRGVNFTAEMPMSYASPGALRMLRSLPEFGVNAIALVAYGSASARSSEVRRFGGGGLESEEGIENLSKAAHALGMRVLLKPHLWVHGSWPANLDFPSERLRAEWFVEYTKFIRYYALLASRIHADLFCVGVELARLSPYEGEWRKLIREVRLVYSGPIVYAAAQGPDFENVQFWDALDYIGLSNYYPLPDDLSTAEVVKTIERVQGRYGKPVIFAEAGFSSYEHPHREPWDETARKLAPEDQARCYEALFQAFYRKPWFQGMYWWKVGTNGMGGLEDGSHSPWRKPAMEVVRRWYTGGAR